MNRCDIVQSDLQNEKIKKKLSFFGSEMKKTVERPTYCGFSIALSTPVMGTWKKLQVQDRGQGHDFRDHLKRTHIHITCRLHLKNHPTPQFQFLQQP